MFKNARHAPSSKVIVSCYKPSCSILNFFEVILKAYTRGSQTESLYSRTGRTSPLYAASFTSCGHAQRFRLRKPGVGLALVQKLLKCVFHRKSFVIVTPRYMMFSTFSRTVPSRVYEAWIFLSRYFVICIILHLTGWNLISHFLAQHPNWSVSFWNFKMSFVSLIFR